MNMQNYGVGIVGVGHYLPKRVESNEELCQNMPTVAPEWILEKTGIKRRYLAEESDSASSLSVEAAKKAIAMAGISPKDIGLIVACTFSGDYIFPPVSAKIQMELGALHAQIFDIQANCSGFVTGLTVASDRMFVDQSVKYALVVGVELHTRFIDRSDVNTAIYFSDGAGAAVLAQVPSDLGIRSSAFHTDSTNYEAVRMRGGGSSFPITNRSFSKELDYIEQNGIATWKQAITHLPAVIKKSCEKAGIKPAEASFFLFHQANLMLIQYVVKKLGQQLNQTYTNVEEIGNTGAASVAIVLSEAVEKGLLKKGDTLVLAAVGAGFNFASSVWKWCL